MTSRSSTTPPPRREAEVVANVEGTGGAIDRYNEWQVGALGRDINPDQLRKRILSPVVGRKPDRRLPCGRRQAGLQGPRRHAVAKFSGHLTVSHKTESEVV